MLEFGGYRFELEEITINLTEMTCVTRYVIYRVDIYRGRYPRKKEVKMPICVETDKYIAESLIEKLNKGE